MSQDNRKHKGFDMDGIEAAIARLEAEGYDSAREQERVADAAREAAGALATVSWWKESIAQFDALEGRTPEPPLVPKGRA